MKNFKFECVNNGNLYEYHFFPKDDELIIQSDESFWNNKVLYKNWGSKKRTPYTLLKYGITNNAPRENILLYLLFINELRKQKEMLAVGHWGTDSIEDELNQKPRYIDWEYHLEHESYTNTFLRNDKGFEQARSPVIIQYEKEINRTPTDKSGIFSINDFEDLVKFLICNLSDMSILTNFYLIDKKNENGLIRKLIDPDKPEIEKLLADGDIFVGLLVGLDLGCFDYLVIKSKNNLKREIESATKKITAFASAYINRIKYVNTEAEMIGLIGNIIKECELKK
jgi:hypothetical protein